MQQKWTMVCVDWLWVFFWNACKFWWRCGWCHLFTKYRHAALVSLTFGANLLLNSAYKSRHSDLACPMGGQHRSNGGTPRASKKQVGKQTRITLNILDKLLQTGGQHLKVWRILVDTFQCFFRITFGTDMWWFSNGFEIIFIIFLNAFFALFEYHFVTSRFV